MPKDNSKNQIKKQRKKRSSISSALSSLFTLIIFLGIAATVVFSLFSLSGPLENKTVVVIERGDGPNTIAKKLEDNGVIAASWQFLWASRLTGKSGQLQAGQFEFAPQISLASVIDLLVKGENIKRFITFPEGLTSLQIVRRMLDNEDLTGDVAMVPPEGTLLPETYDIPHGTTREQLLLRMRNAMEQALSEVWESRSENLPVTSPYELLILASIVEKETGIGAERPLVASVFVNRLRKGMRLQSDPTIIYGLVGGEGKLGRGLFKSEISKPTPYNTYTIPALPPTPIANPGIATLKATANPDQSDYIFFVADGTGGHVFAKTLAEHNANVRKWREIERARKDGD